MKRFVTTLAAVIGTACLAAPALANFPSDGGGPVVTPATDWDVVGGQAFAAAGLTPAEGKTIFAYMTIAVSDAVTAASGACQPFPVDVNAPAGASAEAALAAAAHGVLVHYLPLQATSILDPAYASSLASIFDGQAKADGVAAGDRVAARLLACARG